MRFCIFRAVKILNGYNLSGQMKRLRFQNTCEKAKSDFWNRNKAKTAKVPFFRDTLYLSFAPEIFHASS